MASNRSPGQHHIDQQELQCRCLSCSDLVLQEQRFLIPFLLNGLLFPSAIISQNRQKERSFISKKAVSKLRNVGKKRHLQKFRKQIDCFYERVIEDKVYSSELTNKYQHRFQRYRQSLFTFIEHDGIPWNNNMAERAIRHLAIQRKISTFFFKTGATFYLLLLGITQTCRFQGKSLLKFLLSGEKDIDQFKASKPHKSSVAGRAPASYKKIDRLEDRQAKENRELQGEEQTES